MHVVSKRAMNESAWTSTGHRGPTSTQHAWITALVIPGRPLGGDGEHVTGLHPVWANRIDEERSLLHGRPGGGELVVSTADLAHGLYRLPVPDRQGSMMLRPLPALQNANDKPDSVWLVKGGWKPDTSIPWALTTRARPGSRDGLLSACARPGWQRAFRIRCPLPGREVLPSAFGCWSRFPVRRWQSAFEKASSVPGPLGAEFSQIQGIAKWHSVRRVAAGCGAT
jgi:hypothetical protein